MTLRLHWFIPSHGDGRNIARPAGGGTTTAADVRREPDIDYLAQVAMAADRLGFTGALVPSGLFCEDPWLVAAALSGQTTRLQFMVAFRPGLLSPLTAAQMATTCQRLSGGRLLLNVVMGGDEDEQHRYGDWLGHDERYERAGEFLTVMRGAREHPPFHFEGKHYRVAAATLTRPWPSAPPVFLGGSSDAARTTAARHADVYLAWGETPPQISRMFDQARECAAREGRSIQLGTRFHVISRDTAELAWAEADRILRGMDPVRVREAQRRFERSQSEGQRRMALLHNGASGQSAASLEIYPNMWAGYSLVRPGAGVALVGSHEEVADRITELHALGADHLILSGQPHLEEAYTFGEGVLPLLRRAGLLDPPDRADAAVPLTISAR
ncbi:LLM class flavin-dependent oxidoreductase [Nocardia iowensis]|uniref:LLM class flavin-dependent oxidoreductase n=1 Tax=Nocardia iowensis TaxID=204891 RepID=A0ABX8RHF1_NOCIO|nr:LLM class flavin-dependent oxidoreductase [Nocardia iowensis]QXN88437.1 LLM class flavin-dependent oxidoreductase [Nocardia iowensis]